MYCFHNWTSAFPNMGTMFTAMGNDLADAIRAELRAALLRQYGTLEAAADALGIAYKTLYRHLTPAGKDRTARVSLDFVLDVAAHLERVANVDLSEIYRRARLSLNVGGDVQGEDDAHSGNQGDYARAARKRSKDRGEGDIDHA